MRTTIHALLGCCYLVLSGCSASGDGPEQSEDSIVGTWILSLSAACGSAFTVRDDAKYVGEIICELQNGTFGNEIELGTYTVAGTQITITPTNASCPTSDHTPSTAGFEVNGDNLTLLRPSGALKMERLEAGSGNGSAVVSFGCMDLATGLFTQHDVAPL